jgi:exodeoxyribonuclease-3
MNVVSWNVNGIRAAAEKYCFLSYIANESPDILAIQETKAQPSQLPNSITSTPYLTYWASAKKPGYSGVAIFTKHKPLSVTPLGVDEFDNEGRVLIADYGTFVLISAYFPNSQNGGARLPYKLRFCDAILTRCREYVAQGRHVIVAGDYNIAHQPIDLARPNQHLNDAGFLPEERAWFDAWIAAGFVDTFRYFSPDATEQYSWWSYRGRAREKNLGWRLDYLCVDTGFLPATRRSIIKQDIMGSDHCPVELEIDVEAFND